MRYRVLLCIALLSSAVSVVFEAQLAPSTDFYHFWLPGAARAKSERDLGNPYASPSEFSAVVNGEADRIWRQVGMSEADFERLRRTARGGHPTRARAMVQGLTQQLPPTHHALIKDNDRFLSANLGRRAPSFAETPLLYSAFSLFPSEFRPAAHLFDWIQALAFAAAGLLLWRVAGGSLTTGWIVLSLVAMNFVPLGSDWRNGNFHSVHLLLAAIPLAIAAGPLRRGPSLGWAALSLAALVLYVAVRPMFFLVAAVLAIHVWSTVGTRRAVPAAAAALLAAIPLWLAPCLQFGDFGIWSDWLAALGREYGGLDYERNSANISTSLALAHWTGAPLWVSVTAGGLAVVAAFALIAKRSGTRLLAALGDPFVAAGLGVITTLAASPATWGAAGVIAVLLIVPLARHGDRLTASFWWTLAGFFMLSQSYEPLLRLSGLEGPAHQLTIRWLSTLSWIPLAIGMLLSLSSRLETQGDRP